ncbi:phage distal tail protein [Actinomyces faecalis]|uniref:phage distal tail protein n=1 Tax=Actinomyces faecalis TaxID=2722820 RepID=UPI001554E76C|nr:phage tail domain-containing protein [Actinomyces faecalis]
MSIVQRVTLIADDSRTVVLDASETTDGWALAEPDAGNMDGWWSAPAPRADAKERPQADGAFAPASLLVGARVLTVVAHHAPSSEEDEIQARSLISAISRQWVRIVVEETGRTSHVRGFLSAQAKVARWEEPGSTWSLIFTIPDPLIYGGPGDDGDLSSWESSEGVWSRSPDGGLMFPVFDQSPTSEATTGTVAAAVFTGGATSSLMVTAAGTAASWPVLEVAGPVEWASWTLGGRTVRWSEPVPSGQVLRIDTGSGAVTLAGARVAQTGLTLDDFFQVRPGTSYVEVAASQPALMRIRWRTAWI